MPSIATNRHKLFGFIHEENGRVRTQQFCANLVSKFVFAFLPSTCWHTFLNAARFYVNLPMCTKQLKRATCSGPQVRFPQNNIPYRKERESRTSHTLKVHLIPQELARTPEALGILKEMLSTNNLLLTSSDSKWGINREMNTSYICISYRCTHSYLVWAT